MVGPEYFKEKLPLLVAGPARARTRVGNQALRPHVIVEASGVEHVGESAEGRSHLPDHAPKPLRRSAASRRPDLIRTSGTSQSLQPDLHRRTQAMRPGSRGGTWRCEATGRRRARPGAWAGSPSDLHSAEPGQSGRGGCKRRGGRDRPRPRFLQRRVPLEPEPFAV